MLNRTTINFLRDFAKNISESVVSKSSNKGALIQNYPLTKKFQHKIVLFKSIRNSKRCNKVP